MPSTGKLAELKGRIQEQLNAQIKQANEHLEGLKGRAEQAQAQAAAKLRAKKGGAEQQFRELKQAATSSGSGSRRLGSGRSPI